MPSRTPAFVTHVLDLLEAVGGAEARAMFGGWGLRQGGRMFALILDDALYVKADAQSAPAFEAAGGRPFTYARGPRGRAIVMSYYSVPEGALESPEDLQPWAEKGLAAAARAAAAARTPPRSAPRRPPPRPPREATSRAKRAPRRTPER